MRSAGQGGDNGRVPRRTSDTHPKLWRKSRGGKDYGCYYVTLDGRDVNLGSTNAVLARERIPEAITGRRSWPSDAYLAARAMEPTKEQFAAPAPAPEPPPPPPPAPAASAEPPPAPAPLPPSSPPEPPRQLAPMSEENARAEADATNAAAADTAQSSGPTGGPEAAQAEAGVGPDAIFPPGGLNEFLIEAARALVLIQIDLQAWLIKKRSGKIAAPIKPGTKIHQMAEQAWLEQFKRWYPKIDTVPPGVLAVALPMIFMLPQARGATDPPPTNGVRQPQPPTEKPAEPPPIGAPIGVVS